MKMKLLTALLVLATTAQLINGTFLGCYEDNAIRLLPNHFEDLGATNSPGRCIYRCLQVSSYKYAGVESGTQCFCSNDKPYERMKRNKSECNLLCPGSIEYCGGVWRISVYSVDYLNTKLQTNHTEEAVTAYWKASTIREVSQNKLERRVKNTREENTKPSEVSKKGS